MITGEVTLPQGTATDAVAALAVPQGSYTVLITLMCGGPLMIGQDASTPGPVVLWSAFMTGIYAPGMTAGLSLLSTETALWLTSLNADGVVALAFMAAVGRPPLQV